MHDRFTCHVRACGAPSTRVFIGQPMFNLFVHWPVCDQHGHNLEAGDGYGIDGEETREIVLRHQWGERHPKRHPMNGRTGAHPHAPAEGNPENPA